MMMMMMDLINLLRLTNIFRRSGVYDATAALIQSKICIFSAREAETEKKKKKKKRFINI